MRESKIFSEVRGFTLVELLVAMSILAVLMAVLLPNLMGSRQRARDSKRMADLQAVKGALRMYYNDNQTYPVGSRITDLSAELSQYLPAISQIGYTYYGFDNGEAFWLCTELETGAGDADIESQINCGIGTTQVCEMGIGSTRDGLYVVCVN